MIEPEKPKRPRCETCRSSADVHLAPRPGQIPGAAHAQRWLCASCEYAENHEAARRLEAFRKPRIPQTETLF